MVLESLRQSLGRLSPTKVSASKETLSRNSGSSCQFDSTTKAQRDMCADLFEQQDREAQIIYGYLIMLEDQHGQYRYPLMKLETTIGR